MLRMSIGSWSGKVLALLGLLVVLPAWPVAKMVEGFAKRFPAPVSLPSVLVFLSITVVASVVLQSALGLGAAIAVAFLLACTSPWRFAIPPASNKNALAPNSYPLTTWRLCDPELSTHGLWRAETIAGLPGIADPRNHQVFLSLIQALVRDWSFRSGWPYYQCRVLSATQSGPRTAGPFASVVDSSRVYRITLGLGDRREIGWIHFGAGCVEFQLEPPSRTRLPAGAPQFHRLNTTPWLLRDGANRAERPPEFEPALTGRHPLWDRWLDG
jgi:hypothetical protein